MAELAPKAVRQALVRLRHWQRQPAFISRSYEFAGFLEAIAFVNPVAEIAETAKHHPDIDIRWNRVSIRLSSHEAGGLTSQDFNLAAAIDRLAESF